MRKGCNIRELIRLVFKEEWQTLLGIIGMLITFTQKIPLFWIIFLSLLILILLFHMMAVAVKTCRQLREKHIPLMVAVTQDDDKVDEMCAMVWQITAGYGFDLKSYYRDYEIEKDDLLLRREVDLPGHTEPWKKLVQNFEKKYINPLRKILKGEKIFHVFLNCPAALAVGLGAVAGSKNTLIVYLFNGVTYEPVINFTLARHQGEMGSHFIKTRADQPYQYIQVKNPAGSSDQLYISMNLAGHSTESDVRRLATENGAEVMVIDNTYHNSLSPKADWIRAAQETASTILKTRTEHVKTIHLFLSCPLPLAFAIGMALGKTCPITVYQWFPGESAYHPVLELNHLDQPTALGE
jgi:hypothetical protein